jgi:hypothetical protein
VIGFNSTALLEALAAGKPVIVPDFGEARDPAMSDLVIDLGDAVQKAKSPDDLKRLVCLQIDSPTNVPEQLSPTAAKTLRDWVGNDDGGAGQRVLDAVKDKIRRTKDRPIPARAASDAVRISSIPAGQN